MVSFRKTAANRRNAKRSTGPKTLKGRAASSLNAWKHGLNTRVPEFMLQSCAAEHEPLLRAIRTRTTNHDLSDLIYALAAHSRLKKRRGELMQAIVSAAASENFSLTQLDAPLQQLSRLDSYARKSSSRLGGLLAKYGSLGETNPTPYVPDMTS